MKRLLLFILLVYLLVSTFIYGISYTRVVINQHPYETTSRWIFESIPKGAKILGVHWDDKLPLHLPGLSPRDYGYQYEGREWDLPIYEPDSMPKLDGMAHQLESADFLIFPTQRIPGSILRVPNEYQYSSALLQLLYAGKLGYRLVATFKTQPGVGPFEFNTDLADESISVYDHPKVTIFRNIERLKEAEIKKRILSPGFAGSLPSREDILLMNGEFSPEGNAESSIAAFVQWIFILLIATLIGCLLLSFIFEEDRESLTALAPTAGILILGISSYFLRLFNLAVSTWGALLVIVLLLLIGWLLRRKSEYLSHPSLSLGAVMRRIIQEFPLSARSVGVFGASFLLFLLLRVFQPEIFWGEKTMDLSFFSYFSRGVDIPPQDPWAAGNTMQYYYLGFYFFAELGRLFSIPNFYGYNLALPTIGALLFTSFYGLFLSLAKSRLYALSGAAAICLLSNLEWINLLFFKKEEIDFDFFWATTRLFTAPSFSEYPLWSQLFADFHPHVISQPFLLAALWLMGSALLIGVNRGLRGNLKLLVLGALAWGALLSLNTWDFIALALFLGVLSLLLIFHLILHSTSDFLNRLGSVIGIAGCGGVLALLSALPYLRSSGGSGALNWGWVTGPEFNTSLQILKHLGLWLIPLLIGGGAILLESRVGKKQLIAGALIALVPWLLGIASIMKGIENIPWGILSIASLLMYLGALLCFTTAYENGSSGELSVRRAWSGALTTSAGLAIVLCELFFLLDRMNTIFKFYQSVWMFLGIAAVLVIIELMQSNAVRVSWSRTFALSAGFIIVCISLVGSVFNVFAMLTFQRIDGPRPALDGLAYLERSNAEEYRLARWIGQNIKGVPVVLEAHGPAYQDYTRISMYTGLPTVLGWEHHVQQRGTPHAAVQARKQAIKRIYETTNLDEAEELADMFSIDLIVLGKAERRQYRGSGLEKFQVNPRIYRELVAFGETRLYQRRRFHLLP